MEVEKQQLLRKKTTVNVSTDDNEVKKHLRQLDEPICLFAEGPAERRIRLRDLLQKLGEDAILRNDDKVNENERFEDKGPETTWYHEGSQALKEARFNIACYSLIRAKQRLEQAKKEKEVAGETNITASNRELHQSLTALTVLCSQIGDNRPVSCVNFSPNSEMVATASWSGLCKLWEVPSGQLKQTFIGHTGPAGCIVFHPYASSDSSERICALASSAHDGSVKLWNFDSESPLADVEGHTSRVSQVVFHPSGKFLGTCCYDSSWRLWDLTQCQEVLHQEGHCKPVHCMSFQCDGSVVATGSLDAFGRVWDLRTGRCVMFMEGHLKSIFGIDFSPNGYHLATGSEDNSAKIWDLRKRRCIYTIPAHMSLLSNIKYQSEKGKYLVTVSYDHTAKIWCDKTWQPLRTLSGHDNKIMNCDVSNNDKYIVTSSYDRTFKVWGLSDGSRLSSQSK